jgi:TPR repeat protein
VKPRITPFFAGGLIAVVLLGAAAAQDGLWDNTVKSAEQGNVIAQTDLGARYADGNGVPQDYMMAAKWYRKAADQRYAYAQPNLAWMYFFGHGVPQDYVRAHMWFNLAATTTKDRALRSNVVSGRGEAAANMTPDQINEAQRMAREWKQQSVKINPK